MYLFILLLQSVALFFIFSHLSLAAVNKASAGPYKFKDVRMDQCDDKGTEEIKLTSKLKKMNRNDNMINMTLSMGKHKFNDNIKVKVDVQKFSNGGFKSGYFVKEGGLCSLLLEHVPKFAARLFEYAKTGKCPFAGDITVANLPLVLDLPKVPMFFYAKYRVDVMYMLGPKKIGCIRLLADVIPK